ncbi:hypothetical protein BTA51_06615 [Hahella sp. CCB-MM4]|nr:hypothetical protein BTA51_06615 [Hahella sp. CCB-MM4]
MVKWVVITKSTILDGCPIHFDDSEFMYGYSVVFAGDSEMAIGLVRASLLKEVKLELQEIIECKLYQAKDWQDNSKISRRVNEAYEEASQTGELVYGPFTPSLDFIEAKQTG